MAGWRGWPVHINVKTYAEISDRHDGTISQLALSLPLEWARGYVVPSVELIYQDSDYVDYYYGVNPAAATPERPAYAGESASNLAVKARWGFALTEQWLLSGAVGYEKLDSAIKDSPIVDTDSLWSARVGVAYNTDLFRARDYDRSAPETPRYNLKIGAFRDHVDSKVTKGTADGIPGFATDIEDILGATDDKSVLTVEGNLRLGNYHRLEFRYFELGRDSSITLARDISFGEQLFPEGTQLDTDMDVSVFRASYAYSLIRDAQKELSIMVGLHVADFDVQLTSSETGQAEGSKGDTPLPVVGVQATIFLGQKTAVGAKVQIFRTDFDRYEGSLNYAALDIRYHVTDSISIGAGYDYYGMDLSSKENDVYSNLKVRHHGPTVFFTVGY